MKAEKSVPMHLAEAFFIPSFSFSKTHRRQFNARGITEDVMAELEEVLAEPKSYYESGQAVLLRDQREALTALHETFGECAARLEKTDKLILKVLNGEAFPKTAVSVLELWKLIIKYAEAAQKTANATVGKSWPDAQRDTHLAVLVGETLVRSGISLDDKRKGIFVISMGIVFEAMDIHSSDARNPVLRALKVIAKS